MRPERWQKADGAERLRWLAQELAALVGQMRELERRLRTRLRAVEPHWRPSAVNLAHYIGEAALKFCRYLSDTPVSRVRNAYQKMPWGAVRKAITDQDVALAQQVQSYAYDVELMGGAE